jgi:KUP system potassium uptake protein
MAGDIPGAATASPGFAPTTTAPGTGAPETGAASISPISTTPANPTPPTHARTGVWALAIGSIGVVFGDIGTSPLYAFHEALTQATERHPPTAVTIFGVVSLALWALILIVTVKYVLFLMRADNAGEGGVLSLMALAQRAVGRRTTLLFVLGVIGAALFYGDSVITPAISVLSAVEGMKTIPGLEHVSTTAVMGISVVVLLGLFLAQSHGTARVASLFGPIMVFWFLTIAALGVMAIISHPVVFLAFNPWYGLKFLATHGFIAFLVLGAVFLTVTGAEALYADMGHFGRWPIQSSWLFFVVPALMLNYLGQASVALGELGAANAHGHAFRNLNWFYELAPPDLRVFLLVLSAVATVIASQAVITGAFSITQQAVQLGLLPRINIRRTSETQAGQVFVPQINTGLMLAVLAVVGGFQSSDNLSNAYGLAVTGTMVVTTTLAFVVVRRLWKWKLWAAVAFIAPFLAIDITFLSSNAIKIAHGGWFPMSVAIALFLVMWTWTKGTRLLFEKTRRESIPLVDLIEMLKARPPHRVPGTAIYLTSDSDVAPVALMHNLKHNKVLHERNVILTVQTVDEPRVAEGERLVMETVNPDFRKLTIRYGFMESPNVPKALGICRKLGVKFDIMSTSFFLGRRSVVVSAQSGMPLWQDKLFIFLMRNAANPTDFFHIPPGRVVELGAQVTV